MYNELELLKFQVIEEIEDLGEETQIVIFKDAHTGNYIDHFSVNGYGRRIPQIGDLRIYALESLYETLGNLYNAIVDELQKREEGI